MSGKKLAKFKIFVFCVVWFCVICCGTRAERLPVRVFTAANGLGSSSTNQILRDSRGFLWVCTRDGLSRFDGERFVTYHLHSGASPNIIQILERRNGDYLVVPQGGGTFRFNAATTVTNENAGAFLILNAEKVFPAAIGRLYEDKAGRLLAAAMGAGLLLLKEENGKFTSTQITLEANGKPLKPARIIESVGGGYWLTTDAGLLRLAPDFKLLELYEVNQRSQIAALLTALFEDAGGRIWVGAGESVFVIKPKNIDEIKEFSSQPLVQTNRREIKLPERAGEIASFLSENGLSGKTVRGLQQTDDGRVFITTDAGLTIFEDGKFRNFDQTNGLGQFLTAMSHEAEENLWIAGASGAYRLSVNGFTSYTAEDGLEENQIDAIYEDAAGSIHVGTGRWTVSRFDGNAFTTAKPQLGSNLNDRLWTSNVSFLDSAGAWWFMTEKKLFRFDNISRIEELNARRPSAVFESDADFFNGAFYKMFEDSRGDVWLSMRSTIPAQMGLLRWNRARGEFDTFSEKENFPSGQSPSAFAKNAQGNLWLGFYYGGLARFRNGKFEVFDEADGIPKGGVHALHADKNGRLWIATSEGGLGLVENPAADEPVFKKMTVAEGLSSNNVRAITEDDAGRIYVGTVRGVDRLAPETGKIRHFTTADGLANEFVLVAFKDRAGALWFGTRNGLSKFLPKSEKASPAPQILIAGLRVAGVKREVSELGQREVAQLDLSHSESNLQIDFLSIGDKLRFQYRLEGADKDWSPPTIERTVNFSNLAPGNYKFLVRAINPDGVVSENPAVVSFTIAPPFWQTWIFYAAMTVLFVAFVIWYDRRLTKRRRKFRAAADALARANSERLEELEQVRRRIATDLHDDIGSSLTQISILSEVLRQRVDEKQATVVEPLQMIADSSRELVDSMSDIVWAINPQKDHLKDLSGRMRRFAADVFSVRDIRFSFDAPAEDAEIGANIRREVFLIFKEAVHNVVKHAGCKAVEIHLEIDDANLSLSISDDGCGFDFEQAATNGHGLASMQTRSAGIGGKIEIASNNGAGTRLQLTVPLKV